MKRNGNWRNNTMLLFAMSETIQKNRKKPRSIVFFILMLLGGAILVQAQGTTETGGVRGTVSDADFGLPVAQTQVSIPELKRTVESGDDGFYLLSDVPPGSYTVVFSKDGYRREVHGMVAIQTGRLTELDVQLAGEFAEMDELAVEDIEVNVASDASPLEIAPQTTAVVESLDASLMSKAGQSTVAGALSLVSGATVSEGKYAVIRGLGDRYTSTQINSVRLPSADPEKRAVQLDLFPNALVDTLQVSKTFSPDQQGDSGGGAINIITRAIPREPVYSFKISQGHRDGITENKNFLWNNRTITDYWGRQPNRALSMRSTEIPVIDRGSDLDGVVSDKEQEADSLIKGLTTVVGPTCKAPPADHSWSATVGDFLDFTNSDWRVGGLFSISYSRKYSGYYNAIKQSVTDPADTTEPLQVQSASRETMGAEKILWGRIATLGLSLHDEQEIGVTHIATHAADNYTSQRIFDIPVEDKPWGPNNALCQNTLDYSERSMDSLQTFGRHKLPFLGDWKLFGVIDMDYPIFDWTGAHSESKLYQPDLTRSSGIRTNDASGVRWSDPTCGRDWYQIEEDSNQYFFNMTLPFSTPSGENGKIKFGQFFDHTERTFSSDYLIYHYPPQSVSSANGKFAYGKEVDKYSPVEDISYGSGYPSQYEANDTPIWDTVYSQNMGLLTQAQHPDYPDLFGLSLGTGTFFDQPAVDYDGEQTIRASYWMCDLPLSPWFTLMFGTRIESTLMSTQVDVLAKDESDPLQNMLYVYRLELDESTGQRALRREAVHESEANSEIDQVDTLPAIGLTLKPDPQVVVRVNWSRTIARPTFKELAPIATPIYGTRDAFIGSADLKISQMDNTDVRLEWQPRPHHSDTISLGFFDKEITDVIDRDIMDFGLLSGETVTFPVNYPGARITGVEFEWRQGLDFVADWADCWSVNFNTTHLHSELDYDTYKTESLAAYSGASSRQMQSQPDQLINIGLMYENERHGLDFNIFYNYNGGMLVAGESASFDSGYTPSVYQKPSASVTLGVSKRIFSSLKLSGGMKSPLESTVEQYFQSGDTTFVRSQVPTSTEYSISLSGDF